jgi:hypothetical protein
MALVEMVGAHHDAFLRHRSFGGDGDSKGVGVGRGVVAGGKMSGRIMAWHPGFNLEENVPDPPLAPITGATSSAPALDAFAIALAATRGGDETAAASVTVTAAAAVSAATVSAAATAVVVAAAVGGGGNGNALSQNWRRGVLDGGDVKSRAISQTPVSKVDVAAVRDGLGAPGADLPIAALAAVMKNKAVAAHELAPATLAARRHRLLCDLLPTLFDTVRSLCATSRRYVYAFPELLQQVRLHPIS